MARKELEPNEFKLTMQLLKKHHESDDEGNITKMFVGGLASGVNVDRDTERMAKTAIEAFKKAIDEGMYLPNGKHSLIPLRNEHGKGWHDVLGYIVKAEIDNDYNLWIEAELNNNSSIARDLYANLQTPETPSRPNQLGFSVGGWITKASKEWDAELGKHVRVIEGVKLREVSVVGQPANPTAYVEALTKSLNLEALNGEEIMDNIESVDLTKFVAKEDIEGLVKAEDLTKFVTKEDFETFVTEKFEVMSKALDAVIEKIEEASNSKPEEDISKSVEADAGEGTMEKRFADLLDAFNGFKDSIVTKDAVSTLVEEVQGLRKEVKELGDQEQNRAIAVRKAKEEDEDSPLAKYQKLRQSEQRSASPLEDAVRFALLRKNG